MHDHPVASTRTHLSMMSRSTAGEITRYDQEHFITYARLLDAETAGADWHEVVRLVLQRDPEREPDLSRQCWESHLGAGALDDHDRLPQTARRRRGKSGIVSAKATGIPPRPGRVRSATIAEPASRK